MYKHSIVNGQPVWQFVPTGSTAILAPEQHIIDHPPSQPLDNELITIQGDTSPFGLADGRYYWDAASESWLPAPGGGAGGGGGTVNSVSGSAVDNTDPANPLIDHTTAIQAPYDNAGSGMAATNAQGAVDELDGRVDALEALAHGDDDVEGVSGGPVDNTDPRNPVVNFTTAAQAPYDNATSGLAATDAQAAIDELAADIQSVPDEVVENLGALSGAVPAGSQFGIDSASGTLYYNSGGNWAAVPIATIDLNFTVSDQTGTNGVNAVIPADPPAPAPDPGDVHLEIYDDVKIYFTAVAANWTAPAVVEVGPGENLYSVDGSLTGNRILDGAIPAFPGNGFSLDLNNLSRFSADVLGGPGNSADMTLSTGAGFDVNYQVGTEETHVTANSDGVELKTSSTSGGFGDQIIDVDPLNGVRFESADQKYTFGDGAGALLPPSHAAETIQTLVIDQATGRILQADGSLASPEGNCLRVGAVDSRNTPIVEWNNGGGAGQGFPITSSFFHISEDPTAPGATDFQLFFDDGETKTLYVVGPAVDLVTPTGLPNVNSQISGFAFTVTYNAGQYIFAEVVGSGRIRSAGFSNIGTLYQTTTYDGLSAANGGTEGVGLFGENFIQNAFSDCASAAASASVGVSAELGNLVALGDDGSLYGMPLEDEECYEEFIASTFVDDASFLNQVNPGNVPASGPHQRYTATQEVILDTLEVNGFVATAVDFSWSSPGSSGSQTVDFTAGNPQSLALGGIRLEAGESIDFTLDSLPAGQVQTNAAATPGLTAVGDWATTLGGGSQENWAVRLLGSTLDTHTVRTYSDGETQKLVEFDGAGDPQELASIPGTWALCTDVQRLDLISGDAGNLLVKGLDEKLYSMPLMSEACYLEVDDSQIVAGSDFTLDNFDGVPAFGVTGSSQTFFVYPQVFFDPVQLPVGARIKEVRMHDQRLGNNTMAIDFRYGTGITNAVSVANHPNGISPAPVTYTFPTSVPVTATDFLQANGSNNATIGEGSQGRPDEGQGVSSPWIANIVGGLATPSGGPNLPYATNGFNADVVFELSLVNEYDVRTYSDGVNTKLVAFNRASGTLQELASIPPTWVEKTTDPAIDIHFNHENIDASAAPYDFDMPSADTEHPHTFSVGDVTNGFSITATEPLLGDTDFDRYSIGDQILATPTARPLVQGGSGAVISADQLPGAPDTAVWAIVPGVIELKRAASGGLYNQVSESSFSGSTSPAGVEWYVDPTAPSIYDEPTVNNQQEAYGGNIGSSILTAPRFIRIPATGQVFRLTFTAWQQGGGGAFTADAEEHLIAVDRAWLLRRVTGPFISDEANNALSERPDGLFVSGAFINDIEAKTSTGTPPTAVTSLEKRSGQRVSCVEEQLIPQSTVIPYIFSMPLSASPSEIYLHIRVARDGAEGGVFQLGDALGTGGSTFNFLGNEFSTLNADAGFLAPIIRYEHHGVNWSEYVVEFPEQPSGAGKFRFFPKAGAKVCFETFDVLDRLPDVSSLNSAGDGRLINASGQTQFDADAIDGDTGYLNEAGVFVERQGGSSTEITSRVGQLVRVGLASSGAVATPDFSTLARLSIFAAPATTVAVNSGGTSFQDMPLLHLINDNTVDVDFVMDPVYKKPDQTDLGTIRLAPGERRDLAFIGTGSSLTLIGDPSAPDAWAQSTQDAVTERNSTLLLNAGGPQDFVQTFTPDADGDYIYTIGADRVTGTLAHRIGTSAGAADVFDGFADNSLRPTDTEPTRTFTVALTAGVEYFVSYQPGGGSTAFGTFFKLRPVYQKAFERADIPREIRRAAIPELQPHKRFDFDTPLDLSTTPVSVQTGINLNEADYVSVAFNSDVAPAGPGPEDANASLKFAAIDSLVEGAAEGAILAFSNGDFAQIEAADKTAGEVLLSQNGSDFIAHRVETWRIDPAADAAAHTYTASSGIAIPASTNVAGMTVFDTGLDFDAADFVIINMVDQATGDFPASQLVRVADMEVGTLNAGLLLRNGVTGLQIGFPSQDAKLRGEMWARGVGTNGVSIASLQLVNLPLGKGFDFPLGAFVPAAHGAAIATGVDFTAGTHIGLAWRNNTVDFANPVNAQYGLIAVEDIKFAADNSSIWSRFDNHAIQLRVEDLAALQAGDISLRALGLTTFEVLRIEVVNLGAEVGQSAADTTPTSFQFSVGATTMDAGGKWVVDGAHVMTFPAGPTQGQWIETAPGNYDWSALGTSFATSDTATVAAGQAGVLTGATLITWVYDANADNWKAFT